MIYWYEEGPCGAGITCYKIYKRDDKGYHFFALTYSEDDAKCIINLLDKYGELVGTMMSEFSVRWKISSLRSELERPDISMWKDLEIRGQIKALEWVLHNDR
jgi:hypothetical protein